METASSCETSKRKKALPPKARVLLSSWQLVAAETKQLTVEAEQSLGSVGCDSGELKDQHFHNRVYLAPSEKSKQCALTLS